MMKSNYSRQAFKFIKNNYHNVVSKNDFEIISVGGSVARGYAQNKSDIDLLCISKTQKQYKKIFKKIYEFPIEIHIIPIQYIYTLAKNLKEFSSFNFNLPNSIDIFSFGAKKCNIIDRKLDNITKLLSDWREIKKISDSKILYENSNFLNCLKKSIKQIKFSNSIYIEFEKNFYNYSNIDKLINMSKIYLLYRNKVFSKVLWFDLYVDKYYTKKQKELIVTELNYSLEKFNIFYDWLKLNYTKIMEEHSKINCQFCKDDIFQCNIIRCIDDYIKDAKKARENNWKLGELCSIKKALEYIFTLYKKLNIKDEELEQINKKFVIRNEFIQNIWQLIRKECVNACK